MTQDQALSVLKTGATVFLTGEPGAGKTHTINEYVRYARAHGIQVAVTASTGIAATHIGGMTVHSWSGIGIKTVLEKRDLNLLAKNKHISTRVKQAHILVIEEISMLSAQTLSLVDSVVRSIKQNPLPFGGIQVVFVGDFFQLPPIIKQEPSQLQSKQLTFMNQFTPAHTARFAYDAPVWKEMQPKICYLTEQHRQDDAAYLSVLSAIRSNILDDSHMKALETRKIEYTKAPPNAPKLFSHNANVDQVNTEVLNKITASPRTFQMSSSGKELLVSSLQKSCLSPEKLCVKVGAAVMFTKNNQKEGYINGTLGVGEAFDSESGFPIVRARDGRSICAEPMDWMLEENGETLAKITQVPLRLAWAITVHKSQGMSFDEALIDLRGVFEFGQGYVALSRVRRFSGLYLLGWNERAFHMHPEVLAQDAQFRRESDDILKNFEKLSIEELKNKQSQFISSCGGTIKKEGQDLKKIKGQDGFAKIREKYQRAYRAWDQDQDDELRELYQGGSSVQELSKLFCRTTGSIHSRLIKIGLLEKSS